MKSIITIAISFVIIWGLSSSCEYNHPKPFPEPEDTVYFSTDLVPFFDKSCNMAGCHSTGAVNPDLTAANGYQSIIAKGMVNLSDPENSQLYKKLVSGQSMEQYSTPSESQLVLVWIKQGAIDN